jgi:hypothetical protein
MAFDFVLYLKRVDVKKYVNNYIKRLHILLFDKSYYTGQVKEYGMECTACEGVKWTMRCKENFRWKT